MRRGGRNDLARTARSNVGIGGWAAKTEGGRGERAGQRFAGHENGGEGARCENSGELRQSEDNGDGRRAY